MGTMGFAFEDCLLKHYVRTQGWLPFCRARKALINEGLKESQQRRLRYFTFCAVGAIDVLMLDVAKVIRRSARQEFDTVAFFDKTADAVRETRKRIPGAHGFPGAFVDVVLGGGPDDLLAEEDPLAPPPNRADTAEERKLQLLRDQRAQFINLFPFDVLNLDLEEFVFKDRDELPGRVVQALRKILLWQQRPLFDETSKKRKSKPLDGFTLMFTTQIGPKQLNDDFASMLDGYLTRNIDSQPALRELLKKRTGVDSAETLRAKDFEQFFKISFPKVLAGTLLDCDWYVDSKGGVVSYEFPRDCSEGEYRMLHLVMDVRRQSPASDKRPPYSGIPKDAKEAYEQVVKDIFENDAIQVDQDKAMSTQLRPTLEEITARRNKYYTPEDF